MGKFHASHPAHELELKKYQKPYMCDGCKEPGFGPRYRCEHCDYDLHVNCMINNPTDRHEFFNESIFKFYEKPPPTKCSKSNCKDCKRYCDACGKVVNGFVYHCEDQGWDLHPCCLKLAKELSIVDVKFRLRDHVSSKCISCNAKNLKGSSRHIRGWSYVSECEKYHFHVYCATKMVLEGWKNKEENDDDDDDDENNNCLALENLELPIQRCHGGRNGRRFQKYFRIVKIFLKTIACILLGDPTIAITCFLVELALK